MFVLDLEIRYNDEYVRYNDDEKLRTWSMVLNDLKFTGDYWVTKLEDDEVDRRYSIRELLEGGKSKGVYNSWE